MGKIVKRGTDILSTVEVENVTTTTADEISSQASLNSK